MAVPALGHDLITTISAVEPTCTTDGLTAEEKCSRCGDVHETSTVVPASGHDPVTTISAVESTCTTDGRTAEVKCLRCGEVLETSTVVPAHGYDPITTISAVEPTCTTAGLTAEVKCSRCGEVHETCTAVPALGHDLIMTISAVEPTCTTDGRTEEVKCSRCGDVRETSTVVPAFGHDPVTTISAVESTCTADGRTAKIVCSRCGVVLQESEVLPAGGHLGVVTKPAVEASSARAGSTAEITCSRCGEVLQESESIPALGYIRNVMARQLWPHKKVEVCYEVAKDIGEVADENAALVLTCGEGTVAPQLTFTSDSSYPWTTDAGTHKGSGPSHKSGGYNVNNAKSTMCCTVSGATQVSFYWKVSSESNYDKLHFYVDGTEKTTAISGTVDWTLVTVALSSSSSHTLKWSYEKDVSQHSGSDCGWVDCIEVQYASTAVVAKTVLGDTRCTPGLHRVVWDMETDKLVLQGAVVIDVEYASDCTYSGVLPTSKTLLWTDSSVKDVVKLVGYFSTKSVLVPADVVASHFKLNGSVLTAQFQLADDNYTKCVGAEFSDENGCIYGRATYCRYRDGISHLGEDFDSGSYNSGAAGEYEIKNLRATLRGKTVSRGSSPETSVNTSNSVKDGMTVSGAVELEYSPIDAGKVTLFVDGEELLSATCSGSFGWQPRTTGTHTLVHEAGTNRWTRTVDVTQVEFPSPEAPNPPTSPDANISIGST